ncbi:hypothetical protein EON79_08015 [bacterium]|nr:MAG: hypothetical protein EON79_08015 [bacterium]
MTALFALMVQVPSEAPQMMPGYLDETGLVQWADVGALSKSHRQILELLHSKSWARAARIAHQELSENPGDGRLRQGYVQAMVFGNRTTELWKRHAESVRKQPSRQAVLQPQLAWERWLSFSYLEIAKERVGIQAPKETAIDGHLSADVVAKPILTFDQEAMAVVFHTSLLRYGMIKEARQFADLHIGKHPKWWHLRLVDGNSRLKGVFYNPPRLDSGESPQPEEAEKRMRALATAYPKESIVQYVYASTLRNSGKTERAKDFYRLALTLGGLDARRQAWCRYHLKH